MRFSVELWSPEYGIAVDVEQLIDATERVDATIECPLDDWAPIRPVESSEPDRVVFIDGVRRIDARVWIHETRVYAGVCTSVAAGLVACEGTHAVVERFERRRLLIAPVEAEAAAIATPHATYDPVAAPSDDPSAVYLAIHSQMTALEQSLVTDQPCDVVVFDGPLRGRNDPRGVGYVKTQHVQYLPESVAPVLGRLDDGERTPLLRIGSDRGLLGRFSWYLRLPGPRSHPLSGVVRCELPAGIALQEAFRRADVVTAMLPRFASEAHKEPRAPQNLYPIAGLEHRLRHLLGDPTLLERALRRAAADASQASA